MTSFWSKLMRPDREPPWSHICFPVLVREDTGEWHVFDSWLELMATFETLDLRDARFRSWDANGCLLVFDGEEVSPGEWQGDRLRQLLDEPLSPATAKYRLQLPPVRP